MQPPVCLNDIGVSEIRLGTKVFGCVGTSPPCDHPRVYMEMGDADRILCPYCATVFRFDPKLGADEISPPECLVKPENDFLNCPS